MRDVFSRNLKFYDNREAMMMDLPDFSRIAEVGVLDGVFSEYLLSTGKISRLWLIDPFREVMEGDYTLDPANAAQSTQDARYERLYKKFAADDRVKIIREPSLAASWHFEPFPKITAAYIDAAHDVENVMSDLIAWGKLSTTLYCHDFCLTPAALRMRFGVVQSIMEYCIIHGWEITQMSREEWATVKLEKV